MDAASAPSSSASIMVHNPPLARNEARARASQLSLDFAWPHDFRVDRTSSALVPVTVPASPRALLLQGAAWTQTHNHSSWPRQPLESASASVSASATSAAAAVGTLAASATCGVSPVGSKSVAAPFEYEYTTHSATNSVQNNIASGFVYAFQGSATRPSGRGKLPSSSAARGAGRPAAPSPSSTSSISVSPSLKPSKPSKPSKPTMTGRSPKKRTADGDESPPNGSKIKLAKMDRGGTEDFSSVVKNRLQQYTRTGQACDRCKVRKIRCDALPEGCSHCINLNLECNVTDRVTGRTERRGYMQELEREKNGMLSHIRDLEKLLQNRGVDVKPYSREEWGQESSNTADSDAGNTTRASSSSNESWSQVGSVRFKDSSERRAPTFKVPRRHLRPLPTDSRSSREAGAPLSSIRGTQLSILGTTIDLASFEAPDVDEPPEGTETIPLYNKSVKSFLQSTMGKSTLLHVDLPSRDDAFNYSEWYFMTISPFVPLLHKPSYMLLLSRIYDDPDFTASVPELVTVHMVLAIIYFHCGIRNWQESGRRDQLNKLSNHHYHFALGKMFDLLNSRDLAAIQALTLIASHARAFPKPGSGSIIANMALQRAIELDLHRAPRIPNDGTNLQTELRKRIWWVIVTVIVSVTGRRGLPLPITVNDFDVDFPEPIADELLSDDGVDTSRSIPCSYEAGVAGFKIAVIYMQVFSLTNSLSRDVENYPEVVFDLERQVQEWEANLPSSLRVDEPEHQHMPAIFMRTFALEIRFWLRHPSVVIPTDKKFKAESTRICEETAREFLHYLQQITKLKALDTTWYQMSVYVGCIFAMLAIHWERRFATTPEEVGRLRADMSGWLEVLRETSTLLGCGLTIAGDIGQIVDRTVNWIEHDMRNKKASRPSIAASTVKHEHQQPVYQHPQHHQSISTPQHVTSNAPTQMNHPNKRFYEEANMANQAHYQNLTYREQPPDSAAAPAYQQDAGLFYNTSAQAAAAAAAAVASGPVPDGTPQPNTMPVFAPQIGQHVTVHTAADLMWNPRDNVWQDWATAIADPQNRYGADALLALGGDGGSVREAVHSGDMTNNAAGQHSTNMTVPPGAQWPLIMFDNTNAGEG